MRRSTIALIIVIAALPPLGLAGLGPVPAPDMAVWLATVADAGLQLLGRIPPAVAQGYLRTPEMIIGLGSALALPLIALGSVTFRFAARRRVDRQRRRKTGELAATELLARPATTAWLEVNGMAGAHGLDASGELTRIGHDADNDLALPFSGVQQFHAVIRRTPEAEFMVIDVTGQSGFGIAVNGRRLRTCALRDGDRIEFGRTAVTFHRAYVPANIASRTEH